MPRSTLLVILLLGAPVVWLAVSFARRFVGEADHLSTGGGDPGSAPNVVQVGRIR